MRRQRSKRRYGRFGIARHGEGYADWYDKVLKRHGRIPRNVALGELRGMYAAGLSPKQAARRIS